MTAGITVRPASGAHILGNSANKFRLETLPKQVLFHLRIPESSTGQPHRPAILVKELQSFWFIGPSYRLAGADRLHKAVQFADTQYAPPENRVQ